MQRWVRAQGAQSKSDCFVAFTASKIVARKRTTPRGVYTVATDPVQTGQAVAAVLAAPISWFLVGLGASIAYLFTQDSIPKELKEKVLRLFPQNALARSVVEIVLFLGSCIVVSYILLQPMMNEKHALFVGLGAQATLATILRKISTYTSGAAARKQAAAKKATSEKTAAKKGPVKKAPAKKAAPDPAVGNVGDRGADHV